MPQGRSQAARNDVRRTSRQANGVPLTDDGAASLLTLPADCAVTRSSSSRTVLLVFAASTRGPERTRPKPNEAPMDPAGTHGIFISYAHADNGVAVGASSPVGWVTRAGGQPQRGSRRTQEAHLRRPRAQTRRRVAEQGRAQPFAGPLAVPEPCRFAVVRQGARTLRPQSWRQRGEAEWCPGRRDLAFRGAHCRAADHSGAAQGHDSRQVLVQAAQCRIASACRLPQPERL